MLDNQPVSSRDTGEKGRVPRRTTRYEDQDTDSLQRVSRDSFQHLKDGKTTRASSHEPSSFSSAPRNASAEKNTSDASYRGARHSVSPARQRHDSHQEKSHSKVKVPIMIGLLVIIVGCGIFIWKYIESTRVVVSIPEQEVLEASEPYYKDIDYYSPTPVIAQYGDLLLHSPVNTGQLTELLFHQAEVPWALVLTTQLPRADVEQASNNQGTHRGAEQPTGDVYLNGSALHVWRTNAVYEMDTSVDCGGAAGATVYAPVTGTVRLVRTYYLEGSLEDYAIHIVPDGYPDIEVVLIHVDNPIIAEGDTVEAGVTKIAEVRDIASYISGIQLASFTSVDDGGNHTHLQVSNRNYSGYPY